MTANRTLLQHKYANTIEAFAKRMDIPIRDALDLFYASHTYQDMQAGVSDMHCRSDAYLAEELEMEINRSKGGL